MQIPELSLVRKLRKKLGITQNHLANEAEVSQSLIARIESGGADPRYSKVVRIFNALNRLKGREIVAKDIMTPDVVGIQSTDSIGRSIAIMKKHYISQIPVFLGDAVVGSLSEQVILDQIAHGADLHKLSNSGVEEFMQEPFPDIGPNTPLSTISAILEHNRAVLVKEGRKIKGIITKADLLKVVY